jgi:ornithine decarboxylase
MGDRSSIARKAALPKQQPQEQLFDTHPEVSLDFEIVRQAARQKYTRPFLILDTAIVRDKVRRFRAAMPRVRPHYAVKANPDRRVLKVLAQEGAGFEIASTQELDLLLEPWRPAAKCSISNPIKSRESIAYAAAKGVEWFVVDSVDELRRVTRPGRRQAYLRIATPNIGADWPLSGKFGAGAGDAREIVAAAAKLGADLAGVTFHVGSQCRNPENWRVALEKARGLFDVMARRASSRACSTSAAAIPVRHVKPIPSIEVIGEVVNEGLKAFPDDVQVIAEPGPLPRFRCRLLRVPRAGNGDARRQALDALGRGPLRRVIESSEGLKYRSAPTARARTSLDGRRPTCDSVDIVMRDEPLPSDLQEGDFVYIRNAGAYTTAYASQFNGFRCPKCACSNRRARGDAGVQVGS